jgi:assimilatory nitrate reductase catalytic subunit
MGDAASLEGRLLHPEVAGKRASWDRAIKLVAKRFADSIAKYGPDSVAFYISGPLLTEDYYVANKLMKGFIGSANIIADPHLGLSNVAAGHIRAFGEDIVPATYEDLDRADLIVMIGSDSASRYPVIHERIMAARVERDIKLVIIDSHWTGSSETADLYLPIQPGSEAALMNGLLAFCEQVGATDPDFLANSVMVPTGFWENMRVGHDIWSVAKACAVAPALLKQFFTLFAATPCAITLFSPDMDRAMEASDCVNAILNVHLATGRVGKPGAGPFCIADHASAMGGREVGALPSTLAAHMDFTVENVARVGRFWAAPHMATKPSVYQADPLAPIRDGRIKALWVMGASLANDDLLRESLASCPFVALSDSIADMETGSLVHVGLPAADWAEKDGTITNADRLISRQRALFSLPRDARPDWWIITQVARAMGWRECFPYDRPADIYREHARLSAYQNTGQRLFNLKRHASMSNPAYDELTPWRWGEVPFDGGHFPTPDGKARLVGMTQK